MRDNNIGIKAIVLVKVIGEAHYQFGARYLDLENIYFIPNFSINLISVSMLAEQSFEIPFNNNKIFF